MKDTNESTILEPFYSLEYEEGLLSSVLTDGEISDTVMGILKPSHFFHEDLATIFGAMLRLSHLGEPTDCATVIDKLRNEDKLDKVGGAYYVTGLWNDFPTSSLAPHYAKKMVEYAKKRKIQEIGIRLSRGEVSALEELDEIDRHFPEQPSSNDVKFRNLKELLDDDTPEPPQLISKGLLPSQSILLLTGAPKTGKSILSLNLALCLAGGSNWHGFDIKDPQKILVLQSEVVRHELKKRIERMRSEWDFPILDESLILSDPFQCNVYTEEGFREFREPILKHQPSVIVVDPLVAFHNSDENSNNEMQRIMQRFRDITSLGISVILVHHSRKFTEGTSVTNARGASAITGAVDSLMYLSRKSDTVTAKFDLRYDGAPDELIMKLNPMSLWFEKYESDEDAKRNNQIINIVYGVGKSGILQKDLVNQLATHYEVHEKTPYIWIKNLLKLGALDSDGKTKDRRIVSTTRR